MAIVDLPDLLSGQKLSHKKYRALIKKHKRKLKRQEAAQAQEEKERKEQELRELSPGYQSRENECLCEEKLQKEWEEKNSRYQHELWLERERIAQEKFIQKKEQEEQAIQEKIDRQLKFQEELDRQEAEIEEEVKKKGSIQQTKKDREEALLRDVSKSVSEGEAAWHNPIAPANFGTELDRENCPFFLKTGACRFGDRCSRQHLRPGSSCTLLIPSMYLHFGMEQSFRDEYDTDIGLEYEDKETYQHFKDFYDDVLPEFKKIGKVVQFKVCCNHEPHLRGNVYIQFKKEEDAQMAFGLFNGRWYGGKQLNCEFTTVTRWKSAICGLYNKNRCPKGKSCNFLHVFRNPRNEFHEADWDLHLSPNRDKNSINNQNRLNYHRNSERSWKYRRYSRSHSPSESPKSLRHHHRSERRYRRKSISRSRSRSPSRSQRKNRYTRESKSRSRSRSSSRSPKSLKQNPFSERRNLRRSISRSPSFSPEHSRRKNRFTRKSKSRSRSRSSSSSPGSPKHHEKKNQRKSASRSQSHSPVQSRRKKRFSRESKSTSRSRSSSSSPKASRNRHLSERRNPRKSVSRSRSQSPARSSRKNKSRSTRESKSRSLSKSRNVKSKSRSRSVSKSKSKCKTKKRKRTESKSRSPQTNTKDNSSPESRHSQSPSNTKKFKQKENPDELEENKYNNLDKDSPSDLENHCLNKSSHT